MIDRSTIVRLRLRLRLRLFAFALVAALAVACHATREPNRPYSPSFGPVVSEACLADAMRGALVRNAPRRVARYALSPIDDTHFYLRRREGRALTEAEGKATFAALTPAGLSTGSSALYSIHRCADVPPASCLHFTLWLCQTSLERFAAELDAALEQAGASDGELGVVVEVLEARGPTCKPETSCPLDRHYGSPEGAYDPSGARRPLGDGGGRCDRDNDCEGAGSNGCRAWYLRGGVETLLYVSRARPTFCGCIENACTWFDQD